MRSLSVYTDVGDLKIGDVESLSVEKKLRDTEDTNVTAKVSIENLSLIENSTFNFSFGN